MVAADQIDLTRSQIKRIVEAGDVLVNGNAVKVGYKLRAGDAVVVTVRAAEPTEAVAQTIPLDVVFEDAHLIVVNKAAGMVVHPAPGHPDGTLVNALLGHCADLSGVGGELRPGIVHRLDKDTSGVMVATKDDATHVALVDMFKAKALERRYLAVVSPRPRRLTGTFDTLHGRHPVHRKRFSSKVERGKRAVTRYETVEPLGDAALVRCRLETGRTHQIRVHFADSGTPIVGDSLYARNRSPYIERHALHAAVLGFAHPITNEALRFETPMPDDMQVLIRALRG